jgi:hypothetical protein
MALRQRAQELAPDLGDRDPAGAGEGEEAGRMWVPPQTSPAPSPQTGPGVGPSEQYPRTGPTDQPIPG